MLFFSCYFLLRPRQDSLVIWFFLRYSRRCYLHASRPVSSNFRCCCSHLALVPWELLALFSLRWHKFVMLGFGAPHRMLGLSVGEFVIATYSVLVIIPKRQRHYSKPFRVFEDHLGNFRLFTSISIISEYVEELEVYAEHSSRRRMLAYLTRKKIFSCYCHDSAT